LPVGSQQDRTGVHQRFHQRLPRHADGGSSKSHFQKTLGADEVIRDAGDRSGARFAWTTSHRRRDQRTPGSGIPEDKLDKVFDPFSRQSPQARGRGWGLTVTKKIIDLHGGSITLRNNPEGGAVVTIYSSRKPEKTYGKKAHTCRG